MIFETTPIAGSFVVEIQQRSDDRGFFARSFCQSEFAEVGLSYTVAQENVSFNYVAGTCRGIHFQLPPHAELKLVRCTAGAIFDVVVDLRPESADFGSWFGVELTAENRKALVIPERCGHGYLTLKDSTEVTYQVSHPYTPGAESGLRPDDVTLDIRWPIPFVVVSDKDLMWDSLISQRAAIEASMAP